jgi:hypothetical protein
VFAGLVIAICLSNCSPAPYGVFRHFEVAAEPTAQCVKETISSTDEVILSYVYDTEKGPSWTLSGERLPIAHGYVYQSQPRSTASIGLTIAPNGSGKVRVDHYQLSTDEKQAQIYAVATRQLMKDVELRIMNMCGMTMIDSTLDEKCHGCALPKSSS